VPRHNTQEPLQPFPPTLNDLVGEAVGEDLAGKRGNVNARGLALEDIAKGLKVGIPSAHERMSQLECRDIGLAHDLVVSVHLAAESVSLRISDFYLKEAFGDGIHLLNL